MEVRVHIPFEELVSMVRQLSTAEKTKLLEEFTLPNSVTKKSSLRDTKMAKQSQEQSDKKSKNSRLTELLLNGPVFTEEQIKTIEETRKSINQWRTKPL